MAIEHCRSCNAPIVWAKTEKGKPMPVDAEPVADGNIELQAGIAKVVKAGEVLPGTLLYKSHFATCVHAASHRKK